MAEDHCVIATLVVKTYKSGRDGGREGMGGGKRD